MRAMPYASSQQPACSCRCALGVGTQMIVRRHQRCGYGYDNRELSEMTASMITYPNYPKSWLSLFSRTKHRLQWLGRRLMPVTRIVYPAVFWINHIGPRVQFWQECVLFDMCILHRVTHQTWCLPDMSTIAKRVHCNLSDCLRQSKPQFAW
jgi:hypothetical protein